MTVKYALYEESFELRFKRGAEITLNINDIKEFIEQETWREPHLIGYFGTLDAAQSELNFCAPTTSKSNYFNYDLVTGEVYYIAEEEFDEDGEFSQSTAIYDFVAKPYK